MVTVLALVICGSASAGKEKRFLVYFKMEAYRGKTYGKASKVKNIKVK